MSFGPPLSLCSGPALGGVGAPSGPSARSGEPKFLEWGECGIGSDGISLLTGAALGAPLITTSGGAGDVLSDTGDRRGVMGAPPPGVGLLPSVLPAPLFEVEFGFRGDPAPVRSIGEAAAGDEGPGAEFDVERPGFVGPEGDLAFESLLFVRGKLMAFLSPFILAHRAVAFDRQTALKVETDRFNNDCSAGIALC